MPREICRRMDITDYWIGKELALDFIYLLMIYESKM